MKGVVMWTLDKGGEPLFLSILAYLFTMFFHLQNHHRILCVTIVCTVTDRKELAFHSESLICLSVYVGKILFGCLFVSICFWSISKKLSNLKCNVSAIFSLQNTLHSTMPRNPWANTQVKEYLEGSGIYLYVKIKHCCHLTSDTLHRAAHEWVQRCEYTKGDRNLHFIP